MKKLLLVCAFFCIGLYPAYGMEKELPKHTKVCCRASLAVYEDGDRYPESKAARLALENKKFKCFDTYTHSTGLKMQLWVNENNAHSIIAIRGTELTYESILNIFSDAAIIKYGLQVDNPYAYILEFMRQNVTNWYNEGHIDDPVELLPSTSTIYDWLRSSISAKGLGSLFIALAAGLGIYKYDPETQAINTLIDTCKAALQTTKRWIAHLKKRNLPMPMIAGHSLGGYIVDTVTELFPSIEISMTFNAPGGAGNFIKANKKELLDEPESTHEFRKITKNIRRRNEVIACFGDALSREDITIDDYKQEGGPINALSYLWLNHGIIGLAKDLKVLEGD